MKLSNAFVSLVAILTFAINEPDALAEQDGNSKGVSTRVLYDEHLEKLNCGDVGDRKMRRKLEPIEVDGEWKLFFFFGDDGVEIEGLEVVPPYEFKGRALLEITDLFCKGDQFEIYDNDRSIGMTPFVPDDGCTDLVFDIDEAFADPTFSSGSFVFGGGSHALRIFAIENPYGGGAGYLRLSSCDIFPQFLDVKNPDEPLELMSGKLDLCKYKKTSLTIEAVARCAKKATLKLFDAKTGDRIVANTETVRPFTLGDDIDGTGEILAVDELKEPGKYRIEVSEPGQPTYKKTFNVGYYSC